MRYYWSLFHTSTLGAPLRKEHSTGYLTPKNSNRNSCSTCYFWLTKAPINLASQLHKQARLRIYNPTGANSKKSRLEVDWDCKKLTVECNHQSVSCLPSIPSSKPRLHPAHSKELIVRKNSSCCDVDWSIIEAEGEYDLDNKIIKCNTFSRNILLFASFQTCIQMPSKPAKPRSR